MNRRPALLAAASFTAAALFALSACGGGGDSEDSDKIAGADSGDGAKKSSPSASASADGVDRPEIVVPKDVNLEFAPETTGDAKADAVLRDNAEYWRAIVESIEKQDPKSEAVRFYSKDAGLLGTIEWSGNFIKNDLTLAGTVRFTDRKVKFSKDGSAGLTYCSDESKGYTKDRKTHKKNVTPAGKDSYIRYNDRLRKNADGVWQLTNSTSEMGSALCQP
ncbi:hypothetical protein AB0N81_37420 [Streptomyces sp. NPDC093510]|uniref:hypothetical protein n=1 Tax=Streptomyces sp. NPDC093510 TaxID=3155199 RepID=UPI00343A1B2A